MFVASMLLLLSGFNDRLIVTAIHPAAGPAIAMAPCRCGSCDYGSAQCNCDPASAPQALGKAPHAEHVPSIVESSNDTSNRATADDSAIGQAYELVQSCGRGGCGAPAVVHSPTVQPSARVNYPEFPDNCSNCSTFSNSCGAGNSATGGCASGACGAAIESRRAFRPVRGVGRFLFGRRCR